MAFSAKDKDISQILEIVVLADISDTTLQVTAVKFYRTRQKFADNAGVALPFTGGAAVVGAGFAEIELGSVPPPPSVIRIKSTFQA